MSTELDLKRFRGLLISRRRQLLDAADQGEAGAATVELDQSRFGRLSRMDALQSQAMSAEANRRHRLELERIAAALLRIDSGEYGYCARCGEVIAPGRLEIDPAAEMCIECARRSEGHNR